MSSSLGSRERSSQQGRTEGEKGGNCSSIGRAACCDKANVKKGPWSPEEDAKLKSYIEQRGTGGNWIALPKRSVCYLDIVLIILQLIFMPIPCLRCFHVPIRPRALRQDLPPPVAELPPAQHQAWRVSPKKKTPSYATAAGDLRAVRHAFDYQMLLISCDAQQVVCDRFTVSRKDRQTMSRTTGTPG
ncbi:hypothetical protein BHM03_00010285 [Ensete ventricosum]|uniref:Uncharacterized protein n=1 Tax=Ensete ventricosum TaxID=4639 RepID=A0A445MD01_ENSVE|nr:hypothetical protein BHM03_00010285 [Ensete ventricosum]